MAAPLHRRTFLKRIAVLTAAVGLAGSGRAQTKTPYTELSATAAVRALRTGDMSAEAYAEALLARAQACRHLHAFITQDPEAFRHVLPPGGGALGRGRLPGQKRAAYGCVTASAVETR